jgi:hypothetical protein
VTDVRSRWLAQWADADRRSREVKDSQSALIELFAHYRALSPGDRLVVNDLLAELAESSEESVRFDVLALISEFGITSALPALRRLADMLEHSDDPGALYEWAKVNRMIARLEMVGE